jgi:tripeptide aminopeptidase
VSSPLVDELITFASIPAPTFAEEARLEWLEGRLGREAGALERDAVGNLVWRLGPGRPAVALLAHVDTVFPIDAPLAFAADAGRLTGPGIGDNAAAVVIVVDVVAELAAGRGDLPLVVVFTVGEEGLGDLRGAREACERLAPEAVIAVEGHGLEQVLIDAVGSVRLRLTVTGSGGHSWEDRGTPSAIHALLRLGARLVSLGLREAPVNVGLIRGGQSVNTIAAEAELVVELRSLEERALEQFVADVALLEVEAPLAFSVEQVGRRPAGRIDRSAPLLAVVREVRDRLGLPDELAAGSTDANAALARGIPALTLGVARGGLMHSTNEWLEEATLTAGREQLRAVVEALLPRA